MANKSDYKNTKSKAATKAGSAKASSKTTAGTKSAAPKVHKAKAEKKAQGPRHPKARVTAAHGTKADLAKTVAAGLVREDEDSTTLASTLATASNQQLLRLKRAVDTMTAKFGSRAKLLAAIGTAENKGKDKDFLGRLDKLPLPQLLDMAGRHTQAAAKAAH